MFERRGEFHTAARDIRKGGLGAQLAVDGYFFRGFSDRPFIGNHPSGGNGGLRLGAALEQAALDQQTIGTSANSHGPDVATQRPLGQRRISAFADKCRVRAKRIGASPCDPQRCDVDALAYRQAAVLFRGFG
jgi:hypothetical protein